MEFFFSVNIKKLLKLKCTKIQLPQKHFSENSKINDHKCIGELEKARELMGSKYQGNQVKIIEIS